MTARSPWRVADAVILAMGLVVGASGALIGWLGVSATPGEGRQTSWLNLGIGGLVLAGVTMSLWLTSGRRAVGQRRRLLFADAALTADEVVRHRPAPSRLVFVPGLARYHIEGCPLVAGKPAERLDRRTSGGLSPCGVCGPVVARDAT